MKLLLGLDNPDKRRALRSIVQAVLMVALVALLWRITGQVKGDPALVTIARGALIIVGLSTVFYGGENVTRAVKLTGPADTSLEFGVPDAGRAAQEVADAAQDQADTIKGD